MADRNEMTDERAWTIGAIVGAVAFVLLWLFVFGFLGSLFLGIILGLVVAIVLLMRGRPTGPVPRTMQPQDRATPGTERTGLVRKGPGPANVGEPVVGDAHGTLPVEARGGAAGDMVPEAGGRRDDVVPGGETSSRNAEGDMISGTDVARTGARGPDFASGGTSRAEGPEADQLAGEGDAADRVSPPAGGPGRPGAGDGTLGGSGDDASSREASHDTGRTTTAGFASTGTVGEEARTGTPAPDGSGTPVAGDEDGTPMRGASADSDAADAGAPLRTDGDDTLTAGAMGGYGRDDTGAGMAGGPGGGGTLGDSGAMGSDALGDAERRDPTAGVADAVVSDPSAGDGIGEPRSGMGYDAGRDAGVADAAITDPSAVFDDQGATPIDRGSASGRGAEADWMDDGEAGEGALDPAEADVDTSAGGGLADSARRYGQGVEGANDGARGDADRMTSGLMASDDEAEPGAIEPGETIADIVEEEEIPDVPSELDARADAGDPAGEAIGDTAGMRSAAADPVTAAEGEVGSRPQGLDGPRGGSADDLKLIKGVGPKLEGLLNDLGIYHFDQVAAWGADEVAWCDSHLVGFKGRVTRDDWVEQAKLLADGGETEFSKRAERDDIYGENG